MINGDVKIVAVGEESILKIFINMLREGPSMARVDKIQTSEIILGEQFTDFSIRY
jgi:acylphosphatase